MEKKPLVSVIIPCHNSSAYLFRLMDSLLSQTYPEMEVYTIDNDSKDNTAEIIKDYIPKFKERGYSCHYIHQDDLGPSAAMQTGFKYIKGDYLVMPDSDDFYSKSTSIETYINKFLSLPEDYAIIRSQLQFINEDNMMPMKIVYEGFPEDDPGTLFEDCLFGRNGYNYAPIDYMVKVSALREMTGLSIYNAYNTGQQRQVCLPLYYKYKAWTIPEPLACYLVRKNSISHGDYSKLPTQLQLYNNAPNYIDSIFSTIASMPEVERKRYRNEFLKIQCRRMCFMAHAYGQSKDLKVLLDDYNNYGGNVVLLRVQLLLDSFKKAIRRIRS